MNDATLSCFVIDEEPHGSSQWTLWTWYERDAIDVLGEQDEDLADKTRDVDARRCFNCGSTDHAVSACPSPRNHQLISLSRQLFNFFQSSSNTRGGGEPERIHVVEAWKQQRLEWLEIFGPGEVKGSLLRDALGLDAGNHDGEWLRNMTIWGYPKGWVGEIDPREVVRNRIGDESFEGGSGGYGDDFDFSIFGEAGEEEHVSFSSTVASDMDQERSDADEDDTPSSTSTSEHSPPPSIPQRWATYPPTYFSSTLLPLYTGFALPSLLSESPSSYPQYNSNPTFTSDRQALWERIVESPSSSRYTQSVPPWRNPTLWNNSDNPSPRNTTRYDVAAPPNIPPPPPPPTSPPPLPPESDSYQPPLSAPPLVLTTTPTATRYDFIPSGFSANDLDEADMDMSDSDSD